MNKEDIIGKIWSTEFEMSREKVRKIVNQVFTEITDGLLQGEVVKINGFGIFDVLVSKSTKYRDPRTGKPLDRPIARLRFKSSRVLKDHVKAIHED